MTLKVEQVDKVDPELLNNAIFVPTGSEVKINSYDPRIIADRSGFIRVMPRQNKGYLVMEPGDQVVIEYQNRTPRFDLVTGV